MVGLLAALALTGATVVPDARYGAGWLFRFFFGSQWREAWTVPIEAPVLDLDSFDGGLVPERRGGGLQTINVHFKSANGRSWVFRSMDKDPTRVLDPDTRESVIGDIFQDLTSTAHPCAAMVVAPLLEAVGILHAKPQLAVRVGRHVGLFGGALRAPAARRRRGIGHHGARGAPRPARRRAGRCPRVPARTPGRHPGRRLGPACGPMALGFLPRGRTDPDVETSPPRPGSSVQPVRRDRTGHRPVLHQAARQLSHGLPLDREAHLFRPLHRPALPGPPRKARMGRGDR